MRTLPVETLSTILRLDPETGRLYWRERPAEVFSSGRYTAERARGAWNARYAGAEALTAVGSHGYRCGGILGEDYLAHMVVFALANGRWPVGYVDHRDTDKSNNRPSNLREATARQNSANAFSSRGRSVFKGVGWHAQKHKWRAYISNEGKQVHLGLFDSELEAARAYDKAAAELFGEFARINLGKETSIMNLAPPQRGHNGPPAIDPDAFEAEKKRAAEFADAAGAWLDKGKIETDEEAGRLKDFIDGARGVVKAIDAARAEAKRPFDEAARAVQASYRPLLDTVERAIARTKPLLTAYLEEKRAAEEKRRAEEAAAARAAAQAAEAAARAAEARHDVAGEAEAAAALDAAKAAEKAAQREVKVGVASATGGGRSAGLRTMKHAKVVNWNLAFIVVRDDAAVQDAITGALNRIIRSKDYDGHEIAGVEIVETRSVA